MKYEEIVQSVREAYKNAKVGMINEHIAVQVNVTGEGEGAFYIEAVENEVHVEPYEYFDRDGLLITPAETIMAVAKGELSIEKALEQGLLQAEGNIDKIKRLAELKTVVSDKKEAVEEENKQETEQEAGEESKIETKLEAETEDSLENKTESGIEGKAFHLLKNEKKNRKHSRK